MNNLTEVVLLGGVITSIGTAILTVASVWKLLMGPILQAVQNMEATFARLETKVDAMDTRHQADIKAIWRHLAESKGHYPE